MNATPPEEGRPPIGDQWREQTEPVSVDGDIDRRRISSGVPSIAPHAVANWPCVSSARVKIRVASGRSVSPRAAASKEELGSYFDSSGQ